MDTSIVIQAAGVIGSLVAVFISAWAVTSTREDNRQKAEISTIATLQSQLNACHDNERSLRGELDTERKARQLELSRLNAVIENQRLEMNELRTDLVELNLELRDLGGSPRTAIRRRRAGRQQPAEEHDEEDPK